MLLLLCDFWFLNPYQALIHKRPDDSTALHPACQSLNESHINRGKDCGIIFYNLYLAIVVPEKAFDIIESYDGRPVSGAD
jgi:hypothetical protein